MVNHWALTELVYFLYIYTFCRFFLLTPRLYTSWFWEGFLAYLTMDAGSQGDQARHWPFEAAQNQSPSTHSLLVSRRSHTLIIFLSEPIWGSDGTTKDAFALDDRCSSEKVEMSSGGPARYKPLAIFDLPVHWILELFLSNSKCSLLPLQSVEARGAKCRVNK